MNHVKNNYYNHPVFCGKRIFDRTFIINASRLINLITVYLKQIYFAHKFLREGGFYSIQYI